MKPRYVDYHAEEMLENSGYLWDDFARAYRRTRGENESVPGYFEAKPVAIAIEELASHGLLTEGVKMAAKRDGLRWLQERIRVADE